jgi:hypothetical protein
VKTFINASNIMEPDPEVLRAHLCKVLGVSKQTLEQSKQKKQANNYEKNFIQAPHFSPYILRTENA